MINKIKTSAVTNIEENGMTGAGALWDGPLDLDNFPKGKGSSSGANGMKILQASCGCGDYNLPISQRAKGLR
tara:strand:- start:446 stop:661 length:216 start_codon:yes stop_codon:yes gene_type:complete